MNLLGRKIEENKHKHNGAETSKKESYFEDEVLEVLEKLQKHLIKMDERIRSIEEFISRTTEIYDLRTEIQRRTLYIEKLLEKQLDKPPVIQDKKPSIAEIYAARKEPLAGPKGKLPG